MNGIREKLTHISDEMKIIKNNIMTQQVVFIIQVHSHIVGRYR